MSDSDAQKYIDRDMVAALGLPPKAVFHILTGLIGFLAKKDVLSREDVVEFISQLEAVSVDTFNGGDADEQAFYSTLVFRLRETLLGDRIVD